MVNVFRDARQAGQRPSATGPAHCAQIRCSQLMEPLPLACAPALAVCKALAASFPLD